MKRFNLLTKDWQLFNENTNFLNLGSNAIMALFGPYRQFYEDLLQFRKSKAPASVVQRPRHGLLTGKAWVLQHWQSVMQARKSLLTPLLMARRCMPTTSTPTASGISHLMSLSLNWRTFTPQRLKVLTERTLLVGSPAWPTLSVTGNIFHTAVRLWMYEKTGNSYWLRPGLRTMGAVDNVAGFTFSVYQVRHQLEMKARMQGKQMNFEDAADPQKAMNEWIEKEFMESFYGLEPTEAQRIAFRREQGITPELLDDQGIDDLIMESRVGERYGGMVPNKTTRIASEFSDELRFANIPGEPGGPVRDAYGRQASATAPLCGGSRALLPSSVLGVGFDAQMIGSACHRSTTH